MDRTKAFITKYVKGATLVEDNMTEVTFQLPDDTDQMSKFERLFKELERSHRDLGVSSFGVSDTSLEEVGCCLNVTFSIFSLITTTLYLFGFAFSNLFK